MILDTNIVIAYLAGEAVVMDKLIDWKQTGNVLYLPSVAETEVLSFLHWNEKERKRTEEFLAEHFRSIPFDRTLAQLAGELRASLRIKFPDAAIAASALSYKMPLVTRNIQDFKKIAGLTLLKI